MTIVAMILSIILGTGSLSVGYFQAGLYDPARWCVLLGVVWILAHWRKLYWFSALGLFLTLIAAAYGVWNSFATVWMLLGALGGLLGWDLSDFAMRLSYAAPTDDIQGLERVHLERVGVVAVLGFGIALLSVFIHVKRLAFEVAVGLGLFASLCFIGLVVRVLKY